MPNQPRGASWLFCALSLLIVTALLGRASAGRSDQAAGWGQQATDGPQAGDHQQGAAASGDREFEKNHAKRLTDLSEYLETMQEKLKTGALTVGVCAHEQRSRRRADANALLLPIQQGLRALGVRPQLIHKCQGSIKQLLTHDILVTSPPVQAAVYRERLRRGLHTLVVGAPHWRGGRGQQRKGMSSAAALFDQQRSLAWDGVNNHGLTPYSPGIPRFDKVFRAKVSMQPQQRACRGVVLVLGQPRKERTQRPTHYGKSTDQADSWGQQMVDGLRERLVLPIWWKAHPREATPGKGRYFVPKGAVDKSGQDLRELLGRAYLLVTGSSAAGLLAMTSGVPVLATEFGLTAWRCSLHSLDQVVHVPLYNRDDCFDRIAQAQWSDLELSSVQLLRMVLDPKMYDPAKQLRPVSVEATRKCAIVGRSKLSAAVAQTKWG